MFLFNNYFHVPHLSTKNLLIIFFLISYIYNIVHNICLHARCLYVALHEFNCIRDFVNFLKNPKCTFSSTYLHNFTYSALLDIQVQIKNQNWAYFIGENGIPAI